MARNTRSNETILQAASAVSNSLKVTVPSFIASQFKLAKGDKFQWKIDRDNIIIEVIRKESSTQIEEY